MERNEAVKIIRKLDKYARDYDCYEMGLPVDNNDDSDDMKKMIKICLGVVEPLKKVEKVKVKQKNNMELSEDAQNALREAIAEYVKTMLELYPVGSYWLCTHGTRGEYEVEIKGFNYVRGGFVAENTETHKTKIVHWASLRSVKS